MSTGEFSNVKVVAFSGGVGGAKLALGLAQKLDAGELLVITNPGDDFDHHGLRVCPDLDTVFYNLAGLADDDRGWGRGGESWNFLEALGQLGGETWFQLGDKDLALHVLRTHMLQQGAALSEATAAICAAAGIQQLIRSATDDPVRTIVKTDRGDLPFQTYFVREQCRPEVTGFEFDGAGAASPAPGIIDVLQGGELESIIFCPSNPYVSLDPILSIPQLRSAITNNGAPKVGVSPIVGGRALKGPAADMMRALGVEPSSRAFGEHYRDLLDGLVIDAGDSDDANGIRAAGIEPRITNTVMKSRTDKVHLAEFVLAFAQELDVRTGA